MRVTITVGSTMRELEVRSDLLFSAFADRHQDAAQQAVARAFAEAYREEIDTVASNAVGSGTPPTVLAMPTAPVATAEDSALAGTPTLFANPGRTVWP